MKFLVFGKSDLKLSCVFARLLQLKSLMSVSILIGFLSLTHLPLAPTNICHPGSWIFFLFQLFYARCCWCSRRLHLVFMSSCLLCSQLRLPSLSLTLDFCVLDNGHLSEGFVEGPCPFVAIAWKEVTKFHNTPSVMPRAISPIRSWCSNGVFKKCMCNN